MNSISNTCSFELSIYEKIQIFFFFYKNIKNNYFLYKATVLLCSRFMHRLCVPCETGLMHATTTPWLQLFLKDVVVWVKTGNATTQHTAMAWNQSMKHAMHLSDAHLVTYTFCRTSNNNCSPQTQGPYASLLSSFLVFEWEQRINKWWF